MDKFYYETTITAPEELIDLLADLLSNLTNEAIEIQTKSLIIRSEEEHQQLLEKLQNELKGEIDFGFSVKKLENVDWIKQYQESIEPIEVGKFYIRPSWHEPKEGLIDIIIDPALAFGSGHHATTHSCLELLSQLSIENQEVLDVGCGSGILGLGAKKLGAKHVALCDTDPLSVDSTKENFELNNETIETIWEGSINQATQNYQLIFANIIADVLILISKHLIAHLEEGGHLILSGILDTKEERVISQFSSLKLLKRVQKEEWVTLLYTK